MPGFLLATLQFFFALTWVVYVIYLPALADQVGFERRHVAWILMMDQVIFLACDWAAGVYADRVARKFGQVGGTMALVTLVSCAAFIALPWIAPHTGKMPFFALTILWSATSSALRAPPFAIVSRLSNPGRSSWVSGAYLFGLGLASAVAPYLSIELKQLDPRIPFALSSIGLAAFTFALARAERIRTRATESADTVPARPPVSIALIATPLLLLAFGFQVHFVMNSGHQYLRFAEAEDLPHLMPIFWIGFNFALLPATFLVRRYGGIAMLVAGGVVGVAALAACVHAPSLTPLVIAQAFAGVAWSLVLMGAFTAAMEGGRPGREGFFTGVLFSVLAAAAATRLVLVMSDVSATSMGAVLESVPLIAWALAAFLVAAIAYPQRDSNAS
jgi:MFS family permease